MFIAKRYHSSANKSSGTHGNIFLVVMGITSLYQVCNQFSKWRSLPKEFSNDAFGEDGECSLMPGAIAQSPECAEAHLFHSWQQEAAAKDEQGSTEPQPRIDQPVVTSVLPDGSIVNSMAVAAAAKDAAAKAAEHTRAHIQQLVGNNSVDSEDRMQEHFDALPDIHRKMTEDKLAELGIQLDASEHEKEMNDIYTKVTESLQSRSSFTDWDQSLVDMQAQLEKRHEDLKHKHDHHLQWLKKKSGSSNLRGHAHHDHAAWSKDLAKMDAKWDKSHKDAQAEHRAWEKSFSEKMLAIGKELCADPERRHTPACAAFAVSDAQHAKQEYDEWEANFTIETHHVLHELCSDPRRANYPVCQRENNATAEEQVVVSQEADTVSKLENTKPQEPEAEASRPSAAPSLRGSQRRGQSHSAHLQWSTVKAWKDVEEPHTMHRELVNLKHDQVRYVHWQGAVPKVGCITAIPSGVHARLQMRYFIDNFKLQAYEGSKQLILVYHHADQEAAELVNEYADGSNIKGVAARGEGTFPSTEALRFGAWSSDADVIAHWEFDEFHHIERLSVQVRAMAMSSRPVSLLKEVTSSKDTMTVDDWGRVETLTGEAAWMRVNWSPLRHLEQRMLKVHAHQVAQVEI